MSRKFANFLDNFLKGGQETRPRRYPYSGKKESTLVKADPELVQDILIDSKSLTTTLDTKKISCRSLEVQVLSWNLPK